MNRYLNDEQARAGLAESRREERWVTVVMVVACVVGLAGSWIVRHFG